ncbi:hypothetical protein [Paenibacillus illinoisensis]|uniref:hypothetical protein n=1 Tax=Paenibacillus illinoisensis TaxID=59845 RepID=UPI00301E61FD
MFKRQQELLLFTHVSAAFTRKVSFSISHNPPSARKKSRHPLFADTGNIAAFMQPIHRKKKRP